MPASPLLMVLAAVFAGILLISNVIANHMLQFFQWTVDAGALTFPITYILSDIFSEVYGYKWSRRIAWTSLAVNGAFALIVQLILLLPQPEWYDGIFFATALGNSWRIIIASLIAYCIGDLADDRVFRHMKRRHKSTKGFAGRALISSFIGNCLDTSLFCVTAFAFVMPWDELPGMIITGICLKLAYECVLLPVTWRVVKAVKKHEDIDNRDK
ncbi:MAG: queuosine precursor transporter [Oscillospiraceae bacterium]|nr:queuosine precursor transporter [Oscillospiraceae bacterium]